MKSKGVKGVINKIKVIDEKKQTDESLAEMIKKHLKMDWATVNVADDIEVKVKNHVAILSGTVKKWSQRKEAVGIALNTRGIQKVRNRIKAEGIDYPWEQYWDGKQSLDGHAAPHTYYFNYDDTFWF